jgi:hypothetical protein
MKASAARPTVFAAAALAALAGIAAAHAQTTSCSLTDYECVQQEYQQVCFDASKLRFDACLAWLREIERSPSLDIRSDAAAIYALIAPNPAAQAARPQLQARREELILGILEEDPWHAGALLGFAGLAENEQERVRRLRDVVTADPTAMHLESLASALMQIGGSELEVAALYARAYEITIARTKGDYAWRFARNAVWAYERAGSPERAENFRKRVARDFGLAAMLEKAELLTSADPAALDSVLHDLCREMTLRLFGAKPCLASIDHLIAAVDRADAGGVSRLEQTLSEAMLTAAGSAQALDAVDAGWRRRFERALRRHVGEEAVARLQQVPSLITIE